jgi:pyridinium-3,5-biscarboxylic acid mononucleotide sulfurtransferase
MSVSAERVTADPDPVIEDLEARIHGYGDRALVAFSGGVDSSVVLALAARALGRTQVEAVTAISPSYPADELQVAAETASELGVAHRSVETYEVEREAYVRNDELRCYHCKAELYAVLGQIARSAVPHTAVLAGANADDLDEFRPGIWAGERAGIRNPLLEASVGKGTVREIARALGLRVSDKPALACLSSRVELGIRVTPELLARIDRAEALVRALEFDVVRVRHRGRVATIEVPPAEVDRILEHRGLGRVLDAIAALGWDHVRVDPAGYRAGGGSQTEEGIRIGGDR